jgi:hypothetical protein
MQRLQTTARLTSTRLPSAVRRAKECGRQPLAPTLLVVLVRTMNQETPPLTVALDRVVDAAQEVVSDHVRFARLEAKVTLVRTVEAIGMLILAATPGLLGWSALMAALHLVLAARLAPAWSLACIGILNLVPALWLARHALQHVSAQSTTRGGTS